MEAINAYEFGSRKVVYQYCIGTHILQAMTISMVLLPVGPVWINHRSAGGICNQRDLSIRLRLLCIPCIDALQFIFIYFVTFVVIK